MTSLLFLHVGALSFRILPKLLCAPRCECSDSVICAVNDEAAAENAEHDHGRHHLIGQKREDAALDKEPIHIPAVDGVSEIRPDENYEYGDEHAPYFFESQGHSAKGEVVNAPAEKQRVVHKRLKNDV